MSKLLKSLVVVGLLAGIVAGCGGKKIVYIPASLRDAFEGRLASSRYIIESPNVIGSFGRVALVREGQTVSFFVGDNLDAKLKSMQSKKAAWFVVRNQTPYVFFQVDFILSMGDTVKVGEAAANLPALRDPGDFYTPDSYITVALDDLTPNRRTLKFIQNKNFIVIHGKVGVADTTDEKGAKVRKFTIDLKNVKFEVNPTNEGVSAILTAIQHEDSPFEGGLQYGTIPASRENREKHGIGGNVGIGYFKYMGKMVVLKFE
jgi:hypothetical protein